MRSVTGTVSSTVVTLSRKAENTAVTIDIINMTPQGLAFTFFADQIATYWNSPERRVMLTISIIPSSSPSVLKSTAAIASCWVRTPTSISSPAPSSATIARFSLSLMMTTYVPTKSVVATPSGDSPKRTEAACVSPCIRSFPPALERGEHVARRDHSDELAGTPARRRGCCSRRDAAAG